MPRAARTAIARPLIPESISMLMLAVFAISFSRSRVSVFRPGFL